MTGVKRSAARYFFCIYVILLIPLLWFSTPGVQKANFTGTTAREFSILAFAKSDVNGETDHRMLRLEQYQDPAFDPSEWTYLLPQTEFRLQVGDLHRAVVLEQHAQWQLVAFYYSNTRTSTSVYRAFADHIEPVSYHLTSHMGQVLIAMLLIVPVWILSLLLKLGMRWRDRRESGQ